MIKQFKIKNKSLNRQHPLTNRNGIPNSKRVRSHEILVATTNQPYVCVFFLGVNAKTNRAEYKTVKLSLSLLNKKKL
jgi:hypothetical protein